MSERRAVIMHSANISDLASSSFSDEKCGNVMWQTLFSDPTTPSDSMCAGIATCPSNGMLALHHHAQPEIYYVLAGTGQIEIAGVRNNVTAGSVIWIPGNVEHGVFCGPDETLKWFYVFPEGRFENILYQFKGA